MRSAFQSGDHSAAGDRRDLVRRQSEDLSKKDQQFEKDLKDIPKRVLKEMRIEKDLKGLLSKDQQKRYDKWKDDRQKNLQAHWRSAHPHGGYPADTADQQDR